MTVPPNTRADIRLPVAAAAQVREGGVPLAQAQGLTLLNEGNGCVLLRAVSGMYAFEF